MPAEIPPEPPKPTAPVLRALERALKSLGGGVLPDPCRADEVPYEDGDSLGPGWTCACGGMTRIALPYKTPEGGSNFATVCVVCDIVTRFPRLQAAVA